MARTRANACGGDPVMKGERALSPKMSDAGRHAIVIADDSGENQAMRLPAREQRAGRD
jgi:hypothetical protein